MQTGHDGADRDVEDLGRVLVGEVADIDEDEHVPEIVRHGGEGVDHRILRQVLDDAERAEAEQHLEKCGYCARRYKFEESLRRFVRHACVEPMPPALKERLSALRTPL